MQNCLCILYLQRKKLHEGTESEYRSVRFKKLEKSNAETKAPFLQGTASISEPLRLKKDVYREFPDIITPDSPAQKQVRKN